MRGWHPMRRWVASLTRFPSPSADMSTTKTPGVESYTVDLDSQKVTARGTAEPQAVFDAVAKCGKKTEWWS